MFPVVDELGRLSVAGKFRYGVRFRIDFGDGGIDALLPV
jgi:hypothetical protein